MRADVVLEQLLRDVGPPALLVLFTAAASVLAAHLLDRTVPAHPARLVPGVPVTVFPGAPATTSPSTPSVPVLIFGREPVLVVAVVEALVTFISLVLLHWSTDQITGIVVAFSAALSIYVAWATRSGVLAALVAFLKVLVIAVAGFGLNLDPQAVSAFIVLVIAVGALWQRGQTTPNVPAPDVVPSSLAA